MSLHEAFISVIAEQPELFSPADRQDLIEKSSTWSDDKEQLGNQIYEWVSTRNNLYDAALDRLSSKDNDKSFVGKIRLPGQGTKAPEIKSEDYKPMLLNAIHRNLASQPQATASSN